jgi:hypothetical protein
VPSRWVARWRGGAPVEPDPPRYLEGEIDGWPDPHGPDPIVFGAEPRVGEPE